MSQTKKTKDEVRIDRRDFVKTVGLGAAPALTTRPQQREVTAHAIHSLPDDGWPSLRAYDRDHLARIALPLGGIGTGTVSLGGRGDLRDWEIMNRPAKGFVPLMGQVGPFFALFVTDEQGRRISLARALGRNLGKVLSTACCFLGFIIALLTQRSQALHDLLASTLVLEPDFRPPQPPSPPPPAPGQGV